MKKLMILLVCTVLFADSPFETKGDRYFDFSMFETKKTVVNKQAQQNNHVKCRWVCDKKIYKEQKIADAILFYKKTRAY